MTRFELDARLAADTEEIGVLPLSRVLLMKDSTYPWCVLVPSRPGIREMHELEAGDQQQLMSEITAVSSALQREFAADKMNVAALGNQVPQLHVHVIVRYTTDPAWPTPIWGRQPVAPYSPEELQQQLARIRAAFENIPGFRSRL